MAVPLAASKGLVHQPLALVLIRIAVLAAIVLGLTALLSRTARPTRRSSTSAASRGSLPVVIVLLLFWTFVLSRTRFGRHLYAVGGNAEAARRAGINVPDQDHRLRHLLVDGRGQRHAAASYVGKVTPGSGGGNKLLYAVGAAVIGGTSLFGGRGRAIDAVIGGLVIATIPNGLGLLNQAIHQLHHHRWGPAARRQRRRDLAPPPFLGRRLGPGPMSTARAGLGTNQGPSGVTTSGRCCATSTSAGRSRAPS